MIYEGKISDGTPQHFFSLPERARLIIRGVAQASGLSVGQMLKRTRSHEVSHPRQDAMRVLAEAGYSTPHIGRILGGPKPYDHTTVLHGIAASKARRANDAI